MQGHGYLNALKNAKTAVYGPDSHKIGILGNIYMDRASGDADFVTVHVGLFGSEECVVSLKGAEITNGHLHIAFPKDVIRHAPNIEPLEELDYKSKENLEEYYAHFGPEPLN